MNSDDEFNPSLLLPMIDDDVLLLLTRTIEAELPACAETQKLSILNVILSLGTHSPHFKYAHPVPISHGAGYR